MRLKSRIMHNDAEWLEADGTGESREQGSMQAVLHRGKDIQLDAQAV